MRWWFGEKNVVPSHTSHFYLLQDLQFFNVLFFSTFYIRWVRLSVHLANFDWHFMSFSLFHSHDISVFYLHRTFQVNVFSFFFFLHLSSVFHLASSIPYCIKAIKWRRHQIWRKRAKQKWDDEIQRIKPVREQQQKNTLNFEPFFHFSFDSAENLSFTILHTKKCVHTFEHQQIMIFNASQPSSSYTFSFVLFPFLNYPLAHVWPSFLSKFQWCALFFLNFLPATWFPLCFYIKPSGFHLHMIVTIILQFFFSFFRFLIYFCTSIWKNHVFLPGSFYGIINAAAVVI